MSDKKRKTDRVYASLCGCGVNYNVCVVGGGRTIEWVYTEGKMLNEYESIFGQIMSEEKFAKFQQSNPWFTIAFGQDLPVPPKKIPPCEEMTSAFRRIFALIFGSFGFEKDLNAAEAMCHAVLKHLDGIKPTQWDTDGADEWLYTYGGAEILLGTVCVYAGRTVEGVYHFMNGLGTYAIGLNTVYSDFIRMIINKLEDVHCGEANYSGRGFSADFPMGFKPAAAASLFAQAALDVIPGMSGKNGEVIVAKRFDIPHPFGSLKRFSVGSALQPHIVDVYESYVIDKDFNLKKAKFYFNGYMPHGDGRAIILPEGFTVAPHSVFHKWYDFEEAGRR